ncbi:hypothetical protein [Ornithinibacillus sp. JPR2-1]|uniref:hypothetical protein n=1 Tax=Ornithinibacillus sp. JPR2-1 TaxID=2094019 RepID=UPI0031DC1888
MLANGKKLIDLDTLIKALYIGYEVDPKFEVNDWVVVNNHGDIWTSRIAKITHDEIAVYVDECPYVDNKQYYVFSKLRHATPEEIQREKERRWWAKFGRNINEYKKGDIISLGSITRSINYFFENGEFGLEGMDFSYKPYELALVCPVENRLDTQ